MRLHSLAGGEAKNVGRRVREASFASIDQSLECAIAIQRAFAAHNGSSLAVNPAVRQLPEIRLPPDHHLSTRGGRTFIPTLA